MYVNTQLCIATLAIASSITPIMARFYIGRFKTEPLKPSVEQQWITQDILQDTLQEEGRAMPYIVYDAADAGLPRDDFSHNQLRMERPPNMAQQIYKKKDYFNSINKKFLGPPTKYGGSGNYANDPNDGFITKNPKDVAYWVPPFTAGGNVNVAFQFWVPISLSGFFIQGRDMENAMKSPNPNAYITKLFLEYLVTNTSAGDMFGDFANNIPFLEQGVSSIMDYAVPYIKSMAGMDLENEIDPIQVHLPGFGEPLSRHKRNADEDGWTTIGGKGTKSSHSSQQEDESLYSQYPSSLPISISSSASDPLLSSLLRHSDDDGWTTIGGVPSVAEGRTLHVAEGRALHVAPADDDGWVTIGGKGNNEENHDDSIGPSSDLHSSSSNSIIEDSHRNANNRLLWNHHIPHRPISSNDIYDFDDGPDLSSPIDSLSIRPAFPNERPTSSHSSYRPSSYRPPTPSNSPRPSSSTPSSSSSSNLPYLTSFDDIPSSSSSSASSRVLDVKMRLSRLDYLFSNLHVSHEECRRRVLCEVTKDPETYSPLSDMVQGETRISGDLRELSRELLNSAEGARLLSYIEAARQGEDRAHHCDVYRYRCRTEAKEIINTDILPIWREVVRWLTVKVMAKDSAFI